AAVVRFLHSLVLLQVQLFLPLASSGSRLPGVAGALTKRVGMSRSQQSPPQLRSQTGKRLRLWTVQSPELCSGAPFSGAVTTRPYALRRVLALGSTPQLFP